MDDKNEEALALLSFKKMKVKELKEYLKKHRQPTSRTKQSLIHLAKGTFKLQYCKCDVYTDEQIDPSTDHDVSTKQENLHVSTLQLWIDVDDVNIDDWPDISDRELYDYLVYTCRKVPDEVSKNARRQLKGYKFYEDGHVDLIRYHKSEHALLCLMLHLQMKKNIHHTKSGFGCQRSQAVQMALTVHVQLSLKDLAIMSPHCSMA